MLKINIRLRFWHFFSLWSFCYIPCILPSFSSSEESRDFFKALAFWKWMVIMWRALCLFFLSFQTTGQWSKSWLYSSSSDLTPSGKWREPHYCWVRVEVQAPPDNLRWPHTVGRGPQYLPAGMGVPVPYLTFSDTTPVETGEESLKCQVTALQGWKFGSHSAGAAMAGVRLYSSWSVWLELLSKTFCLKLPISWSFG